MPISCWIWKPVQNCYQQVEDGNWCCCAPAACCASATLVAAPLAFVFDALTCGQINAKNSWEFPTPCDFDVEDVTYLSCQIWEPFIVYSGFLIGGDKLPDSFSGTSEGCHPFYCPVAAACGLAAATCTPLACVIDAFTCGQCDECDNRCVTPYLPSKDLLPFSEWIFYPSSNYYDQTTHGNPFCCTATVLSFCGALGFCPLAAILDCFTCGQTCKLDDKGDCTRCDNCGSGNCVTACCYAGLVRREGRRKKLRTPIVKTRGGARAKQPLASNGKAGSKEPKGFKGTGTINNPMYMPESHPLPKAKNFPQGSIGMDVYSNEELGVCTYVGRKGCPAKTVEGKPYCLTHLCPTCGINQKSSKMKLCGECDSTPCDHDA